MLFEQQILALYEALPLTLPGDLNAWEPQRSLPYGLELAKSFQLKLLSDGSEGYDMNEEIFKDLLWFDSRDWKLMTSYSVPLMP